MATFYKGVRSLLFGAGTIAAVAFALAGGPSSVRRYLRRMRDEHANRPALWNRFYTLDWGETTTNNYGFAPAQGDHPQRFQHQMYREVLKLLGQKRPLQPGLKLLEVSYGRGGGLDAFLSATPAIFDATGLDIASSAVTFCRKSYGENDRLRFVEGSALDLPFPDAGFDVVLNVEASNDYGDRPRFFAEVAGIEANFTDITGNVAEACRVDSPRRREVIRKRAPLIGKLMFRKQMENYAGIEGSSKYRAFAERRRAYLITAATKA